MLDVTQDLLTRDGSLAISAFFTRNPTFAASVVKQIKLIYYFNFLKLCECQVLFWGPLKMFISSNSSIEETQVLVSEASDSEISGLACKTATGV